MKKALSIVALVIVVPLFLGLAIGGAGYLAYRDNKARCVVPVDAARLRQVGAAAPAGFEVCDERANNSPYGSQLEVRVVLRPSFVCVATRGMVGCETVTSAGMQFVGAMTQAGWGTGRIERHGEGEDMSVSHDFERAGGHARVNLRRSRWGEVSGELRVDQMALGGGAM